MSDPTIVRLIKLPPDLHDGQHSTFVDADGVGCRILGELIADWLVNVEPEDGDELKLSYVEMTKEEFDAIPEI